MRITVKGFNETHRFTAPLPADGTLTVPEACTVRTVLGTLLGTVEQIHQLTENVRERLVERAGLPLVDEVVGVVGVGVGPLV